MLNKIKKKSKGLAAVPVVVILMLVGLGAGYLAWNVAFDVTYTGNDGAEQAYEIITEDEYVPPSNPENPPSGGGGGSIPGDTFTRFTITYNANGGFFSEGGEAVATKEVKYVNHNPVDGAINDPTREGYTFQGWFTTPDAQAGTELNIAKTTDDVMAYASWKSMELTYYIVYESVTGAHLGDVTINGFYGEEKESPLADFPGYSQPSPITIAFNTVAVKTIKIQYQPIPYSITYELDGGEVSSSNPETYIVEGVKVNGTYKEIQLNNPTKTGYEFAGWIGTGLSTANKNVIIPIGSIGNRTYTATWTAKNVDYTVKYWKQNIGAPESPKTSENYSEIKVDRVTALALAGSTITAPLKTYEGFKSPTQQQVQVSPAGDTVVDYFYTRQSYTVTTTAGTGISSITGAGTYQYDENVSLSAEVSPGYSTVTWSTTPAIIIDSGNFKMPANNVSVRAQADAFTYTISYNGNGATSGTMPDQQFTYDKQQLLRANTFARTGYTFDKWNTQMDGSGDAYSDGESVRNLAQTNTTVVLYAQWKANSYKLTVDHNGGTCAGCSHASGTYVPYGTKVTLCAVTKSGATFSGWSKSGVALSSNEFTMPAEDVTVVATWATNPYEYDIVYKCSSGEELGRDTVIKDYGTTNTITPKDFEGHTTPSSQIVSWDTTSRKTITFTYSPIEYNITYKLNSGTVATANPATYNIHTATFTLNNPTRSGYQFAGWTGSNGSTAQTSVSVAIGSTGDKEFTANWSSNSYYVKYNGNGATAGSMSNSTHEYGTAKALTANAYSKAYTVTFNYNGNGNSNTSSVVEFAFTGWNRNAAGTGTAYVNQQSVKNLTTTSGGTVNLYAQWEDNSIILPTPTRTGYTFAGWYDAASGGNKIGAADDSYTPTSNITLYAHWTGKNYQVKYNGNGATSGSMSNSTHVYGTASTLRANAFSRVHTVTMNYNGKDLADKNLTATATFLGWSKTATGAVTHADKASVKTLNSAGGTTNLYAQWELGSVTLGTPTRTGYTFAGWYDAASGGNKIGDAGATYTPSADITVYAHWTAKTYTYNFTHVCSSCGELGTGTATYAYGKTVTLTPKTFTGHTAPETVTVEWNVAGTKEVTVTHTPNTYTVKFNKNGGTGTMSAQTHNYCKTKALTPNTFIKEGYMFTGWNTKADGSGTAYANKQSVTKLTSTAGATINLYAQWSEVTKTFNYKGSVESWTVPVDGLYKIEVWGAQGGSYGAYTGGKGGYAVGYKKLEEGAVLYAAVGGKGNASMTSGDDLAAGWNGGGKARDDAWAHDDGPYNRYHGTGGGATHIATASGQLSSFNTTTKQKQVIIVAGGGGGIGGQSVAGVNGGAGGGKTGSKGANVVSYAFADATGGSQTAGGSGAMSGSFGQGGNGGGNDPEGTQHIFGIGGGGGGWYGGGAGRSYGSGAGGSSYIANLPDVTVNGTTYSSSTTANLREGNGLGKITYITAY